MIGTMLHESEEEVLKRFPELLDAAEKGHSTIINWHARPVAVLAPVVASGAVIGQHPLTPWQGTGGGLWEEDSARTVRRRRDEWSR